MSNYGHLLTSQVQAIYDAVQSRGVNPRYLEWHFMPGEVIGSQAYEIPALVFRPDQTYFAAFALDGYNRHHIGYRPGYDVPINIFDSLDWSSALQQVNLWLANLTREIQADDPWAALIRERRVLSPSVGVIEDNSPFDPDEQQRIIELLNQKLDEILHAQRFNAAQVRYLTQQIAYLTEAVTRLGRRDWWGVAASTLFQIGLAAMFAPDARQAILSGLAQAVHSALTLARLLGP